MRREDTAVAEGDPVAVCLAGQARTLRLKSTLQLLARNFWRRDYRLFLSVDRLPPSLLRRMAVTLGVNASGIEQWDVPTQTVAACKPGIYGLSANLRSSRLLPMARRVAGCARLIDEAVGRGEAFSLVVRSRPDLRFTQPVAHARQLLARAGGSQGAAALLWDDQLMVATLGVGHV